MSRILFVEQFYYPEGWGGAELPRAVTSALATAGHDVTVICGSDQYVPSVADPATTPENCGVKIRRIPSIAGGAIHNKKLLKQLWFYCAFLPRALFRRRTDLYIAQTNPPLIVVLVSIVSRIHRRPYMIIAQDLYPEMLSYSGMLRDHSLFYRVLVALFRGAYRHASKVVVLGETMAARVAEKGVPGDRIVEISNWATGDLTVDRTGENPLRSDWELNGKYVFLYSGNLGKGHEFHTLLKAFQIATSERKDLILVFVGAGQRRREVENLVIDYGLTNWVRFNEYVPSEMLKYTMGVADVAIVTLNSGAEGLIVPSKAIGYMARALPILYIGPNSDIATLLRKSGGGAVVSNGDVNGAAQEMLRMVDDPAYAKRFGTSGEAYYRAFLAEEAAIDSYKRVIDCVLSAP